MIDRKDSYFRNKVDKLGLHEIKNVTVTRLSTSVKVSLEIAAALNALSWEEYGPGKYMKTLTLNTELGPILFIDLDAECPVCLKPPTNIYMVRDALWAYAGLKPDSGLICVDCFQNVIGRELIADDLKPIPANDWLFEKLGYSSEESK